MDRTYKVLPLLIGHSAGRRTFNQRVCGIYTFVTPREDQPPVAVFVHNTISVYPWGQQATAKVPVHVCDGIQASLPCGKALTSRLSSTTTIDEVLIAAERWLCNMDADTMATVGLKSLSQLAQAEKLPGIIKFSHHGEYYDGNDTCPQ